MEHPATLYVHRRGVFILETEFRLESGSGRAGVVFGANDFRLLDHTKNELGLEGENFLRFEVDFSRGAARLDIYRVGYASEDQKNVPFASTELVNFRERKRFLLLPGKMQENFISFALRLMEIIP